MAKSIEYNSVSTRQEVNTGLRIGNPGGGHYADVEADGTMVFVGDARVWEDMRVDVLTLRILGAGPDPALALFRDNGAGSMGVYAYMFDDTIEERLWFSRQLPHSYAEGTDIVAHVHWAPMTANQGTCRWGLEYTWQNQDGGAFANTAFVYGEEAVSNQQYHHLYTPFTTLSGAGKTISSVLMCRVFRDATHLNDDLAGDVALLEVDFHAQMNMLGSHQELVK